MFFLVLSSLPRLRTHAPGHFYYFRNILALLKLRLKVVFSLFQEIVEHWQQQTQDTAKNFRVFNSQANSPQTYG